MVSTFNELSYRRTVLSVNCQSMNCQSANSPSAKCPSTHNNLLAFGIPDGPDAQCCCLGPQHTTDSLCVIYRLLTASHSRLGFFQGGKCLCSHVSVFHATSAGACMQRPGYSLQYVVLILLGIAGAKKYSLNKIYSYVNLLKIKNLVYFFGEYPNKMK